MKIRYVLIAVIALGGMLFSLNSYPALWPFSSKDSAESKQELAEITWDDLVPDDFVPPENPYMTMSQEEIDKLLDGSEESNAKMKRIEEEFSYAPTVAELDGMRVKIPAYITPLEYNNSSKIREFLLVPYVGACIHTPPPPANQIVYVKAEEAVEFGNMYDPIWATGVIRTETVESDLAETGYRLELESVTPYEY